MEGNENLARDKPWESGEGGDEEGRVGGKGGEREEGGEWEGREGKGRKEESGDGVELKGI